METNIRFEVSKQSLSKMLEGISTIHPYPILVAGWNKKNCKYILTLTPTSTLSFLGRSLRHQIPSKHSLVVGCYRNV